MLWTLGRIMNYYCLASRTSTVLIPYEYPWIVLSRLINPENTSNCG